MRDLIFWILSTLHHSYGFDNLFLIESFSPFYSKGYFYLNITTFFSFDVPFDNDSFLLVFELFNLLSEGFFDFIIVLVTNYRSFTITFLIVVIFFFTLFLSFFSLYLSTY